MAHIGRFFPVHFRRDFNADGNIKNTGALAKGYTIELRSGAAPPYLVDGHTFDMLDIGSPDDHTVEWLSPAQFLGIWLWQVRLHVSWHKLPDSILQATWYLERDAILVSSWRGVHESRENPLAGGNLLTHEILFTDFTTFERGADFNFSHTSTAGYPP